jgi:hypothetical protein
LNRYDIDKSQTMKSIPSHVLKNAVVIVPRKQGLVNLSILPVGIVIAGITLGYHFLIPTVTRYSSNPILLLFGVFLESVLVLCFAALLWISGMILREAGLDTIAGYDPLKEEVIVVKRCWGRPRAVIQIALAKVQTIRIDWQVVHFGSQTSSHPVIGGWNAQLVLQDEKAVHLGHLRGEPDAPPPASWLTRFKQVSALLNKPLEILPAKQVHPSPPVDALISRVQEQSSVVHFVFLIILIVLNVLVIAAIYISRLGR